MIATLLLVFFVVLPDLKSAGFISFEGLNDLLIRGLCKEVKPAGAQPPL